MYACLCVYMRKASSLVHSARTIAQHSTLQLLLQCICLISCMCLDSQVTPLTCLYHTLKTIFQRPMKGNTVPENEYEIRFINLHTIAILAKVLSVFSSPNLALTSDLNVQPWEKEFCLYSIEIVSKGPKRCISS